MSDSANPAGFEGSDAPPPLLIALAAGFALTVAAVMTCLTFAFPSALHDQEKGPLGALPPAPRLETAPRRDRIAYEQAQRKRLGGYGWSDRANGRVQVPVDQAMNEVATEGWRSDTQ